MAIFELRGQVADALTHNGISGCEIEIWLVGNSGPYFSDKHGSTISNGFYNLTGTFDKINKDVTQFFLKVIINEVVVQQSILYAISEAMDKVLVINIEVDTSSGEGNMRVQGRLLSSDGTPVPEKYIVAYDKTLSDVVELASATSNEQGYYSISYDYPSEGSYKVNPDIIIKVFSNSSKQQLLATSPLFLSANAFLEFNFTTDAVFKNKSQFSNTYSTMVNDQELKSAFFDQQVPGSTRLDKLKNLTSADISYISNRLQVDNKEILLLLNAAQLLLEGNFYTADNLEILYGIFSITKDTIAQNLFFASSDRLLGIITTAGEKNNIKIFSEQVIESFVDDLRSKLKSIISHSTDSELSDFFTKCGVVQTNYTTKEKILDCLLQDIDSGKDANIDFISSLKANIGSSGITPEIVDAIELYMVAFRFSQSRQFTTELLDHNIVSIDGLIQMSQSDLLTFIQTNSVPRPGIYTNDQEFATAIRKNTVVKYPEQVLSLLLSNGDVFSTSKLKQFQTLNVGFPLMSATVDELFLEPSIVLTGFDEQAQQDLRYEWAKIQRLCYIAPVSDWENALEVMWNLGIEGSTDVVDNYTEDAFVDAYTQTYSQLLQSSTDVSDSAKYIFRLSHLQFDINLITWSKYSQTINSLKSSFLHAPTSPSTESSALPTFEELFGGNDFCRCSSARSVTSPAAYLADLLNIEVKDTNSNDVSTLGDLLPIRRPEIKKILLNEKNAFTELPYIDLVIELFGTAIQDGFNNQSPPEFNTNLDQSTLEAIPEHLEELETAMQKVYSDDQQHTVVYPWSLPYNYWLEECRVWFDHLTFPRDKFMELFFHLEQSAQGYFDLGASYATEEPLDFTYYQHDPVTIAGEYFRMNTREIDQIFNVQNLSYSAIYNNASPTTLINIAPFLRKSGLSYSELKELLQSYYVNPIVDPQTQKRIYIIPEYKPIPYSADKLMQNCSLEKASFVYSSSEGNDPIPNPEQYDDFTNFLLRIYKYTLLKRKLRMGVPELDLVIDAVGYMNIETAWDHDMLTKIHELFRLSKDYSIDLEDVTLFYNNFSRDRQYEGYTCLFDKLFRNNSYGSQENVFTQEDPPALDEARVRGIICATLGLNETDYYNLLINEGLYDPKGNDPTFKATTENLSLIYRTIRIISILNIDLLSYYRLISINNNKPPVVRIIGTYNPLTQDTIFFIKCCRQMQKTGISAIEMTMLLGNRMVFSLNDDFAITDREDFCIDLANKLSISKQEHDVQLGLDLEYQREIVIDNLSQIFTTEASYGNGADIILKVIEMDENVSVQQTDQVFIDAFGSDALLAYNTLVYQGSGVYEEDQYKRYSFCINLWDKPIAWRKMEALREAFSTIMPEHFVEQAFHLVNGDPFTPANAYSTIIQPYFSIFMDPEYANQLLILGQDPANFRFDIILGEWEKYLLEPIVISKAAEACSISEVIATGLIKRWIQVVFENNDEFIIERFLDQEFIDLFSTDLWKTNAEQSVEYLYIVDLINKAVYFIKKYIIDEFTCDFIKQYHYEDEQNPYFHILNIFNLPVFNGEPYKELKGIGIDIVGTNQNSDNNEPEEPSRLTFRPGIDDSVTWLELWQTLDYSFALNKAFAMDSESLFEVWNLTFQPNEQIPNVLQKLALVTGWNYTDIYYLKYVVENLQDIALLQNVDWVKTLSDQLYLVSVTGISPYSIIRLNFIEPGQIPAKKLRSVVKSKYSTKQWLEIAKAVMDPLRMQLRDIFVDYLIGKGFLTNSLQVDFDSVESLYDYFLIDPLMNPCSLTSRVVQATMALQVLAQRILLNLESGVTLKYPEQWSWYKNYRVWEACRKVFLYPENWLEPEWREDKSEIFTQLEDFLKQNDVTTESGEKAYIDYVGKLVELSDLEVISIYKGEIDKTLYYHFLGRTRSLPHIYYYRRYYPRDASGSHTFEGSVWTPWEKVDIDIESDTAALAVVNDIVYVFWPVLMSSVNYDTTKEGTGSQEIRVAFTSKKNNVWNRKIMSETGLNWEYSKERTFINLVSISDDNVIKLALCTVAKGNYFANSLGVAIIMRDGEIILGANMDYGFLHTLGYLVGGKFQISTERPVVVHNITWTEAIQIVSAAGSNDYLAIGNMIAYYNLSGEDNVFTNGYEGLLPVAYKNQNADWYGIPHHLYGDKYVYQSQLKKLFSSTLELTKQIDVISQSYAKVDANCFTSGDYKLIINQFGTDSMVVSKSPERESGGYGPVRYKIYPFDHLFISNLRERILKQGVLSLSDSSDNIFYRQNTPIELPQFISIGNDAELFKQDFEVDFNQKFPYSSYNWELFFHIPMLVAGKLSANLQFEDAQKWYHLIFDPTNKAETSPEELADPSLRVWKFKPFYKIITDVNIREILYSISDNGHYNYMVEQWKKDPLNTFALALTRVYPLMRNVVMKYLDNLISWGDYLFSQDTMESLNEATQIYILASEILGPRPVIIDTLLPSDQDFQGLSGALDVFSNSLFPIETVAAGCRNKQLYVEEISYNTSKGLSTSTIQSLYFGIPYNQKLLTYWDTVEDRLFKLRNCMNLKGSIRELPLFQPPIDPALLIQATQAGLDFSQIVASLNLPASCYRYRVLILKARDLVNEVVSLGSSLLSAMEKKDAESLALLRSSQEKGLLKVITYVKEQAISESQASIESLEMSIANTQDRYIYYSGRPYMNDREKENLDKLRKATFYQHLSQDLHSLVSILGVIPQFHIGVGWNVEAGGSQLALPPTVAAMIVDALATYNQYQAQLASIKGGYDRRQDDWSFQAAQATGEEKSLQKQLIGAKVRLAIAEKELSNHELQIQHADDNYTFLKDKFTNEQLYSWMISELSTIYFQAYKLAVDYAHQAERAFKFETSTKTTSEIISYNHWDNLREGLMAGERLRMELNLLDKEYMDKNVRNLEITKNISLAMINPAALSELRASGNCEISIPEYLFDLDYPGQYSRRIKSVAISIPAVSASNTNISCKLTLLNSCYRFDSDCPETGQNGRTAYDQIDSDTRFVYNPITSQAIATSSAMNDRGVFDFNFNDERYLPFEGAGAISAWKLELPEQFRQFDYDSISDVILHMSYSALDAGEILKSKALESLTYAMEHGLSTGVLMALPLEWKAEFVDELFHVQNESAHSSEFVLGLKHFPTFVQDYLTKNTSKHLEIQSVDFVVKGENLTTLHLKKESEQFDGVLDGFINEGYVYTRIKDTVNDSDLKWQLNNAGSTLELSISESTGGVVENIWMIVNYTCS